MSFSEAEIDAALEALSRPGRLNEAQDLITRAVPGLQRILGAALNDGGWFDTAHQAAVGEAIATEDLQQRDRAVRTLLAEETRLTMLVGVAVGYELARELGTTATQPSSAPDQTTTHARDHTTTHAPDHTTTHDPDQATDPEE